MKKLLFSLLAVVAAIGLIGGAFAYFSDVTTSVGNTMTAGTLDVIVNGQPTDNNLGATFSIADWAPGTLQTVTVSAYNNGTIPIQRIYVRFGGPYSATPNDFGDKIKLAYYAESTDGTNWNYQTFVDGLSFTDGTILPPGGAANAADYWAFWTSTWDSVPGIVAPHGTSYITLADLYRVREFGSGDHVTSLVLLDARGGESPPPLAHYSTVYFKFGFLLDGDINNAYQGATVSFGVNFIASQVLTYPDTGLWESMTTAEQAEIH